MSFVWRAIELEGAWPEETLFYGQDVVRRSKGAEVAMNKSPVIPHKIKGFNNH